MSREWETPDHVTTIYSFFKSLCALILRIMFDQKSYGENNVPRTGGVLVVSNHVSYLDPAILAAKLPRKFAYLADSGLWTFKPFGWTITRLNAFPVTQGKGDIGAMKQTISLLNDGWALTIFPEGMRSLNGKLSPVQAGAALVIKRTNVPVVPAFIYGAYQAWPKHNLLPRRGKVRVIYRPALDFTGQTSRQITETLSVIFKEMEAEAEARFAEDIKP